MKVCVYGLMVLVLGFASTGLADVHIFSDKKGRSIKAELVRYDDIGNKVTLKRVDTHSLATVPIDIFSDADQKYIRKWGTIQDLQGNKLKVDIRRLKKEVNKRATSASTEVFTAHSFKIVFDNETYTTFDNLELEYVMYYEQEHHKNNGYDVEKQKGTFYQKKKITLTARKTVEFSTEPVKLYTWKTYSLKPVAAEMIGIRIRLTLSLASGEKVVREFSYPDGLDNEWVGSTIDATVKNKF